MAVGDDAEFLPGEQLIRAVQERLSEVVDEICRRLLLLSKGDRARRLRTIFDRNVVGSEHWSSLASELYVSRRQFFRERKLLCDEICTLLKTNPRSRSSTLFEQPAAEDLAFNDAILALQSGNSETAERIVEELCVLLPPGELRSRALSLAADCAIDGLRFDVALARSELAAAAAEEIPDFETRAIAAAGVNVTRERYFFSLSDYERARIEVESALRRLSELAPASSERRADLMQGILLRRAELALHVGEVSSAVEQIQHLRCALGRNDGSSEAAFELASMEAVAEISAGRLQSALDTLEEASSIARRLGFNRHIVQLAIERAWTEVMIDRKRGRVLAPRIAALADAVQIPELKLEAALFCAVNESPHDALEYGSKARAMAPRDSVWAARAMIAQANACFKLGRLTDAWGVATEGERLASRVGNHRMRAAALESLARIKLKCGDKKAAMMLKKNSEDLLRLYGLAPERDRS